MLDSLENLERHIGGQTFPILRQTRDLLDSADSPIETVADMASVVARDPGLTITLLRKANNTPHEHLNHRLTNIEYAVMMYGMGRVQQMASKLPIIEEVASPKVLPAVLHAIGRATHAAYLSLEWARLRRDMVPAEVYLAALLHNIGEIALWLFAPREAEQVVQMVRQNHVSVDEAHYMVLGFSQDKLSLALTRMWNMPALVQDSLQPANALHARVLGVLLAAQLAHLREGGWKGIELEKCIEQLSRYVQLARDEAFTVVKDKTRQWEFLSTPYGTVAPVREAVEHDAPGEDHHPIALCIAPQTQLLLEVLETLGHPDQNALNVEEILELTVKTMHDGIGLNRVVFAHLVPELGTLTAKYIAGADADPQFSEFAVDLNRHGLFRWLLTQSRGIWVTPQNRKNVAALIPEEFNNMVRVETFFAQSIYVHNRPFGIFYADRQDLDCRLDASSFHRFQALAHQAELCVGAKRKR